MKFDDIRHRSPYTFIVNIPTLSSHNISKYVLQVKAVMNRRRGRDEVR